MKINIWIAVIGLGVFYSCKNETIISKEEKTDSIPVVKVNAKQMQTMGIELENLQEHAMNDFVLANGMIDVPPESRAVVTAKMEGFVKHSNLLIGDYVSQGQVLTVLETPRLIMLQEDFLTVKNQIVFLQQEFDRQTKLSLEDVGAKKNLQKIASELQTAKVRMASLEKQLQFIGLNPNAITLNNISSQFTVTSPISGYIKNIHIAKGQSVLPETVLFEITSKDHLHVELQVFEKDIVKIKKGQKVYFQSPNLGNQVFEGDVFLIGQSFDSQTKTVNVHVHFEEKNTPFLPNMYINARIAVGESKVLAITEESVIQEGEESMVFYTTDKKHFYPTPIRVKNREGGLIAFEFIKQIPASSWIVKKGANFLQAATEPAEEE
ncbi:MAG: efflux RND transporter periplasmic adaptor subunit [Raineya sp.]|jgi:cobalt-zinc-cadmium efflux system membrane fusion protein|nr:efflux RND transporter periplasmic adaptor subunit [Raineya sp.]